MILVKDLAFFILDSRNENFTFYILIRTQLTAIEVSVGGVPGLEEVRDLNLFKSEFFKKC